MAATYDDTNLDDTDADGRKNIVRLLIQDNTIDTGTTVKNPEFQDEELAYFLTANNDSIYDGAIAAARSAHAKYARGAVDRQVGDLQINTQARAREWAATIDQLKIAKSAASPPILAPLVGNDINADPNFALGMHDNLREDTSSYDKRGGDA